jgi:hypothetical protein
MTPLKFGKQNFWCLKYLWYFKFHDHGGFSGVIDTAETISAVSVTPLKQLWGSGLNSNNVDYLGEFEAICETVLARESGAQGVLFDEKTEGRKYRDSVPLT